MDISGQDEYLNVADSLEKLSAIGKKAGISMPSFKEPVPERQKDAGVSDTFLFFRTWR